MRREGHRKRSKHSDVRYFARAFVALGGGGGGGSCTEEGAPLLVPTGGATGGDGASGATGGDGCTHAVVEAYRALCHSG